jgi:NDP-sugar pyrophosphorylase family protein
MKKQKIAISVAKPLLDLIDSKVDGNVIRSRSQAVEYFLRKGLKEDSITTAVILLRGEHQPISLRKISGKSLIKNQLDFFYRSNIEDVFIVTQHTRNMGQFLNELVGAKVNVEVIEKDVKGNAKALEAIKGKLRGSFVVMSGDTYNNFDLIKMARKHLEMDRMATMGLMTRQEIKGYGTAILDGDFIVDFQEKPKQSSTNIVNAGIYCFKKEVFELFDNVNILEKDIFPKLARMKQLIGFFTYGEYMHLEAQKRNS